MSRYIKTVVLVVICGIFIEIVFLLFLTARHGDLSRLPFIKDIITAIPTPTISPIKYVNPGGQNPATPGTFQISTQEDLVIFTAIMDNIYEKNGEMLMDIHYFKNNRTIKQTVVLLKQPTDTIPAELQTNDSFTPLTGQFKFITENFTDVKSTLTPFINQRVYVSVTNGSRVPQQYQSKLNMFFGKYKQCNLDFVKAYVNNAIPPTCTPVLSQISLYVKSL